MEPNLTDAMGTLLQGRNHKGPRRDSRDRTFLIESGHSGWRAQDLKVQPPRYFGSVASQQPINVNQVLRHYPSNKVTRGTCQVPFEVTNPRPTPLHRANTIVTSFVNPLERGPTETRLPSSHRQTHAALQDAFVTIPKFLPCGDTILLPRSTATSEGNLAKSGRAVLEPRRTIRKTAQLIDSSSARLNNEESVASCSQSSEFKSQSYRSAETNPIGTSKRSYENIEASGDARVIAGDWNQYICIGWNCDEIMQLVNLAKELPKQGSPPSSLSTFFLPARCSTPPIIHRCPGTNKYLFTTPVWLEWMQQDKVRLLVLTGPLGSGKTAYCISILNELSADPSRMICSHFFNSASAESNTAHGFLTGIISQLWSAVPESAKGQLELRFQSYLKNYERIVDCPNDVLIEVSQDLISIAKPDAILIDGVDECDSELNPVVEALHQIVTRNSLAAIAACREFEPFAHLPYALRFKLEPGLLRNDLWTVIHHDLPIKLKLQGFGQEEFLEKVGRFIFETAQDNFLHTRLLIEIMSTKRTPNQVKRLMEGFDFNQLPDLSARYELINAKIESKLSKDDLPRRAQLLQTVVFAKKPFTLDEINELWAIDIQTSSRDDKELSLDIRREVEDLGQSFLQIGPCSEVTFYHKAARDFFRDDKLTKADPHLYLARKFVAVLSQPRYKDANRAAELLKKHIVEGTNYGSDFDKALSELPLYEYAVKHFHEHVIEVSTPPKDFILQLAQFLQGVEFVCWSEALFDLQSGGSFNSHIIVFRALLRWVKGLSADDQEKIAINDYFELPHVLLAKVLKEHVDDLTLQYLPRIRVGGFLNSTSQRQEDRYKAVHNKEIVVAGLTKILDPKDRLLLKARAALYQEYFWQKEFEKAREDLLDLYKLQLDVIGDFREDAYQTAWLLGYAYIALGEFEEAGKLLQNAADQVRKNYGEEYLLYLLLYFLEGQRLDAIQALDDAKAHYEAVHETLLRLLGSKSGFTLMVKTALGALLRKQQQSAVKAEDLLLTGYAERELIFTNDINVNVDAAMQLALFYRDRGAGEKCIEQLDLVADSEVFQLDFERNCQQKHLRALVAFDSGEYEDPKESLLSLIEDASGAGRDKNNRELLWVRIDLADVMRRHGHDDEAIMLFTDLVCRRTEGEEELRDEPEPVSQLKVAEKALRLVRKAQYSESRQLLQENALEWVREADFWILTQGGPVLDTAIIEPIRSCCEDQVGGG